MWVSNFDLSIMAYERNQWFYVSVCCKSSGFRFVASYSRGELGFASDVETRAREREREQRGKRERERVAHGSFSAERDRKREESGGWFRSAEGDGGGGVVVTGARRLVEGGDGGVRWLLGFCDDGF